MFSEFAASSEYNKDSKNRGTAEDAFDNNTQTCWQNGKGEKGVGESLVASASEPQMVTYIKIRNGHQKKEYPEMYERNSRAKKITVFYDGGEKPFELMDTKDWQIIYLKEPVETTFIRIRIDSVYEGKSNEVCISDIIFG